MSDSRRTGRSHSRRYDNSNRDEFLDLLAALSTTRGSARSHSSRHTWQAGLLPACLEPPQRIQSHFPVPKGTLARVPELSHPDLNSGQRRYLQSIAQIYSLDDTKRSLSNSYYGLLMKEVLKGGGRNDSHKRYTEWIYGNHKRLYETNPRIWRSRKLKSSREESKELESISDAENRRTAAPGSGRRQAAPKSSNAKSSAATTPRSSSRSQAARGQQDRDQVEQPTRKSPTPKATTSDEPSTKRLQSARSRGSGHSRTRPDNEVDDPYDEKSAVRVSEAGSSQQPRGRSAGGRSRAASALKTEPRRGDSRAGSSSNKAEHSSAKRRNDHQDISDDDDDRDDDDGRRPRDLSSIMY